MVETVCFLLGETHELGLPERDFVWVERQQGFGGAILEGRDDLGHGVEHALWHRPWHGGDGDGFDFHLVGRMGGNGKAATDSPSGENP